MSVFADGGSTMTARERTCPSQIVGPSASDRWLTLVRWIEAARDGSLFATMPVERATTRREVSQHVVLALAARGGHLLGGDRAVSAFAGAMIAA